MLRLFKLSFPQWGAFGLTLLSTLAPAAGIAQDVAQEQAARNGLKQVIAIKQELSADVRALTRVAEYQRELLKLARIDPDAARSGRRSQESCIDTIESDELCSALSASYGGAAR